MSAHNGDVAVGTDPVHEEFPGGHEDHAEKLGITERRVHKTYNGRREPGARFGGALLFDGCRELLKLPQGDERHEPVLVGQPGTASQGRQRAARSLFKIDPERRPFALPFQYSFEECALLHRTLETHRLQGSEVDGGLFHDLTAQLVCQLLRLAKHRLGIVG